MPQTRNIFACANGCAAEIHVNESFSDLPRVTSDCRPFEKGGVVGYCPECGLIQKPASDAWLAEIERVYSEYGMFRQAEGAVEQAVFSGQGGVERTRSAQVLEKLAQEIDVRPRGKMLDVGCGGGAFLRAFSSFRDDWELYGHELSDDDMEGLRSIPRFQGLYTCPVDEIDGAFDLISLSHALEHFIDPVETLRTVASKLAPGGFIVVQVPDIAANAFDLSTVDHRLHFSVPTILRTAERSGIRHYRAWQGWVCKQITLVLSNDVYLGHSPPTTDGADMRMLDETVEQLHTYRDTLTSFAKGHSDIALFGVAVAATWLYALMPGGVRFFVDDDPARAGQTHLGLPIYATTEAPKESAIFVGLAPDRLAREIADRLNRNGINASSI